MMWRILPVAATAALVNEITAAGACARLATCEACISERSSPTAVDSGIRCVWCTAASGCRSYLRGSMAFPCPDALRGGGGYPGGERCGRQLMHVAVSGEGAALLEDPLPPAPELWPGEAAGEMTVEAVDSSRWIASPERELLRVKSWSIECINDIQRHKLRNYTGNVSRRKAFLSREGLSCTQNCVRGVVDGFASHAEIEEMLQIAPVPPSGQSSSIYTWRWDVPDQPTCFRTLVRRAQTVLAEHFGVGGLRFYRSNMITQVGSGWQVARSGR
jgi:hypothetical protein|mmetsp:Transcript_11866/g.27154  ORF Transcript_11866/g.27154 Transcript_11866/m.27154 type:complete len:273 (-) Transcript_11866:830-1648(-)